MGSYETINLSTSELANLLNHVTIRVRQTTGAVEELTNSVCAAEQKAAERVCNSVTKGFYTLIHSDVMQKKVEAQTVAEAQLQSLRHLAQDLRNNKKQLGVDFERITARYTKLFKNLADALQSRVYALDRPAAEVADIDYKALTRRVLTSGATAVVVQQDSMSSTVELSAVRCKKDCQKVIEGVKTLIDHGANLNRAMAGIVRNVHQEETRSVYVPVLVCESSDLFLDSGEQVSFIPPERRSLETVMGKVKKACYETMDGFVWSKPRSEKDKSEVARRVRQLAGKEAASKREAKLIAELCDKSDWHVLETVR